MQGVVGEWSLCGADVCEDPAGFDSPKPLPHNTRLFLLSRKKKKWCFFTTLTQSLVLGSILQSDVNKHELYIQSQFCACNIIGGCFLVERWTQNPVGVKLWQVGWELPVDNTEPEDLGGVFPSSTTGIVINISWCLCEPNCVTHCRNQWVTACFSQWRSIKLITVKLWQGTRLSLTKGPWWSRAWPCTAWLEVRGAEVSCYKLAAVFQTDLLKLQSIAQRTTNWNEYWFTFQGSWQDSHTVTRCVTWT